MTIPDKIFWESKRIECLKKDCLFEWILFVCFVFSAPYMYFVTHGYFPLFHKTFCLFLTLFFIGAFIGFMAYFKEIKKNQFSVLISFLFAIPVFISCVFLITDGAENFQIFVVVFFEVIVLMFSYLIGSRFVYVLWQIEHENSLEKPNRKLLVNRLKQRPILIFGCFVSIVLLPYFVRFILLKKYLTKYAVITIFIMLLMLGIIIKIKARKS